MKNKNKENIIPKFFRDIVLTKYSVTGVYRNVNSSCKCKCLIPEAVEEKRICALSA